ncbi:Uncharacterised protein [Mycobacteroides abscessus subsp. abscessus]|nr:Uncharacterised protein [Mycobacteroides abscessus subsp. abscessus]
MGNEKGEAKIWLVVLNEVISVHSMGAMTMIVQTTSRAWATVANVLSPAEDVARRVGTSAVLRVPTERPVVAVLTSSPGPCRR